MVIVTSPSAAGSAAVLPAASADLNRAFVYAIAIGVHQGER
jgi:hypothetical protein